MMWPTFNYGWLGWGRTTLQTHKLNFTSLLHAAASRHKSAKHSKEWQTNISLKLWSFYLSCNSKTSHCSCCIVSVWKCLGVHVINKYDWTEIPSAAAKYCASGTHYMGQSHISQHQTFCSASVLFSLLLNCGSKLAVKSSWKNLFG